MCAVVDRFDAGTQPAGRPPAPGRLAYVQAFLNTFWDLDGDGGEVWSTPGDYGAWLDARGFDGAATEVDLERALDLRKALQALCLANHEAADVPEVLAVLDVIAADVAPAAALAPSLRSGALEPTGDGARRCVRAGPGDRLRRARRRQLRAAEGVPARTLRLGLLRFVAQSLGSVVLDAHLRQPHEG